MSITYHAANINDIVTVTELIARLRQCPYCGIETYEELFEMHKTDLTDPANAFFVAYDNDKGVGIAMAAIKDEIQNTNIPGPAGFLEEIYVEPDYRGKGIAKALVTMCEDWSREKGCKEFTSSCDVPNTDSMMFHLKIGFIEENRVILFAKKL